MKTSVLANPLTQKGTETPSAPTESLSFVNFSAQDEEERRRMRKKRRSEAEGDVSPNRMKDLHRLLPRFSSSFMLFFLF